MIIVKGVSTPLKKTTTFPQGGTYSGNKNITDGTGTMVLFTRTAASFAGSNVPTGTVTVTAVVSQFTDAQLNIRNLSDVNYQMVHRRTITAGARSSAPSQIKYQSLVAWSHDPLPLSARL